MRNTNQHNSVATNRFYIPPALTVNRKMPKSADAAIKNNRLYWPLIVHSLRRFHDELFNKLIDKISLDPSMYTIPHGPSSPIFAIFSLSPLPLRSPGLYCLQPDLRIFLEIRFISGIIILIKQKPEVPREQITKEVLACQMKRH